MSLLQTLDADLKAAMKNSDRLKTSVLRLVKSAIKNRQIELGREFSDEDICSVLASMVKQRRESVEQYSKAGRDDLAGQEAQEIQILQSYLPAQFSAEELDKIIRQAIAEASATNVADIGKVMKIIMPRIKGRADGKWVNSRIKELLSSTF